MDLTNGKDANWMARGRKRARGELDDEDDEADASDEQ